MENGILLSEHWKNLLTGPEAQARIGPAFPLMKAIAEMGLVITDLSDKEYSSLPSGLFTSTPGAQVRHILDHAGALIRGRKSGSMDYEARLRGTPVETSREEALKITQEYYGQLQSMTREDLNHPVVARLMLHPKGEVMDLRSSIGRELAFVLSHTIHHNAILFSMIRYMGKEPPPDFGFAPATIAFMHSSS